MPLLQIVPSKTDVERLLVISPELADVLSRHHQPGSRGTRHAVPLVAAYDDHDCVCTSLFGPRCCSSGRIRAEDLDAIPAATIRKILAAALARTGLTDPSRKLHCNYTPHDFRRMSLGATPS